nr:transposase [Streptomyces megasporus]
MAGGGVRARVARPPQGGDTHDRLRDKASLAALSGAGPVERFSGKSQRRRLNRGGNRQAGAALHRIVLSRPRWEDGPEPACDAARQRARRSGMSSGPEAVRRP